MFEAEGVGERLEQLLLRGGLGQLAAQRLARVLRRVLDELALFAALRASAISMRWPAFMQSASASRARSAISCDSRISRGAGLSS